MNTHTGRETMVGMSCACCGESVSTTLMTVPNRITHWMLAPDATKRQASSYDLLRCSSCSHVWLGNRPAPMEMSYYYGAEYHQAIGTSGEAASKRWARQLQTISKYKHGGDILDIGCSSGGFLASLKGGPWRLYGIEASLPTAERARALTGADVFAGDVADADFPPNSFDVITCSDVLEHLYEPYEVFQKVSSWLKPGGIFYIFVPNILSWEARMFRSYWYALDLPRHLHHFSARSLARLATSVDLHQLRLVTPAGSYLEHSISILLDDLLRRAGVKRTKPLNLTDQASISWRIVRKGLRCSIEALYRILASCCGAGPSIQAVFQKSDEPSATAGKQGSAKFIRANTPSANQPEGVAAEVSLG
jgi:SAM-dependent methyltransferase